jgi:UDP-N-acetylmuramoyl-L-alanyl-D-glutamate--2,6-diaminopimelate ligase
MKLTQLLKDIPGIRQVHGDLEIDIRSVTQDSRRVEPGDCFVAVRGYGSDGHAFINQSILKGAVAVVCDPSFDATSILPNATITLIQVEDTAISLGWMASAFFNHPSRRVKLVGVTGTNGKTSVTTLLWQCFTRLGHTCGLIGTVENRIGQEIIPSTHTTPGAEDLHHLLFQMAEKGCNYVFIEASSHAIHQHRIAGIQFAGGVFTNLTHDHLDYHKTFAAYRDAKKQLFDQLPTTAFCLTNADDKNGLFMTQNTRARVVTYGIKRPASYKAKVIESALTGLHLLVDGQETHARLIGSFNAYNLLAVYGVCRELGVDPATALTAISGLTGAEGRFDYQVVNGIIAIVDYAHTPDALEQVLETIIKLRKGAAQIITVVGAGGDRDKAKRPVMAKIAAACSDQVILTSDNPRTESPEQILKEMEAGLDPSEVAKTITIENREQAIKTAVRLAAKEDIILVAGKGHEKYQEIRGVKHPFDDKAMLAKYLTAL